MGVSPHHVFSHFLSPSKTNPGSFSKFLPLPLEGCPNHATVTCPGILVFSVALTRHTKAARVTPASIYSLLQIIFLTLSSSLIVCQTAWCLQISRSQQESAAKFLTGDSIIYLLPGMSMPVKYSLQKLHSFLSPLS